MRKSDLMFVVLLFVIGLVLLPLSSQFEGYELRVAKLSLQGVLVVIALVCWFFGGLSVVCILHSKK